MNRKNMVYLSFVVLVGLLSLWGCPKKTEVTASPESQSQTEKIAAPTTPASTEKGASEAKDKMKSDSSNEKSGAMAEGLKPIYFDFDKSVVRHDAKAVMKANAEWLKANPGAKISIEGNCDERGTVEYNQALGKRRAASAKNYLTAMGVSARRISLISYGKEKPICTESTEECWQKNRRDEFVVVGQ